MSPDDPDAPNIEHPEDVIRALEALVILCEQKGLTPFVRHLNQCVTRCQKDYVTLQRKQLGPKIRTLRRKPPTRH